MVTIKVRDAVNDAYDFLLSFPTLADPAAAVRVTDDAITTIKAANPDEFTDEDLLAALAPYQAAIFTPDAVATVEF